MRVSFNHILTSCNEFSDTFILLGRKIRETFKIIISHPTNLDELVYAGVCYAYFKSITRKSRSYVLWTLAEKINWEDMASAIRQGLKEWKEYSSHGCRDWQNLTDDSLRKIEKLSGISAAIIEYGYNENDFSRDRKLLEESGFGTNRASAYCSEIHWLEYIYLKIGLADQRDYPFYQGYRDQIIDDWLDNVRDRKEATTTDYNELKKSIANRRPVLPSDAQWLSHSGSLIPCTGILYYLNSTFEI